jgi:hypothetical protein
MKKLLAVVFALALLLTGGGIGYADSVDKIKLTKEEEALLYANLSDLGIEEKTQKELVKKWEKGIKWDSMDREKVEAVPEELLTATKEEPVKRYTFPDGSVIMNKLEQSEDIAPADNEIGIMASPGKYYDYRVWTSTGVITASFRVDFTIVSGGNDYISSAHSKYVMVIGGTKSGDTLKVYRKYESGSIPAMASLDFSVQPMGFFGSIDCYVRFYVEGNEYWKRALT